MTYVQHFENPKTLIISELDISLRIPKKQLATIEKLIVSPDCPLAQLRMILSSVNIKSLRYNGNFQLIMDVLASGTCLNLANMSEMTELTELEMIVPGEWGDFERCYIEELMQVLTIWKRLRLLKVDCNNELYP